MNAMFRSAPAILVALAAAASFVNAQSNNDDTNSTNPWTPPKQGPARLTGYPAWHGLREGWNMEVIDAVTLFSIIGLLVGTGLSIRFGHLTAKYSHLNKGQQSSRLLITVFGWYNIATLITVGGFFFVDIGKLWTSMGALHNLTEVGILLTLLFASYPAK
ncbi:hypothetical protein BC937DRAFT_95143 [Endogone sp. FLAS-F59071]|nr:hypothetical protein BC937DRAFT_95143 [Endogone sp. FLAS-F59071]|eukprot:RUS13550.1 hypothetical protein BC937DRAFT_95143 [Endogone sp. FLAS-F59071]